MLERVLIIDPAGETAGLVRFCTARAWPGATLVEYDPAIGLPGASFDWASFDLVLLENDLGADQASGLEWLRELRRNSAVPPIILLTVTADRMLAIEAVSAGAANYLVKEDLTPKALVKMIGDVLKLSVFTAAERCGRQGQDAARQSAVASGASAQRREPTGSGTVKVHVPGYRIERRLAQGSTAEVYLACGVNDSQRVALKIMKLLPSSDAQFLKRFMQEYSLLARLAHPNVVRIHERGFSNDLAFIAMEYCSFGDLRARVGSGLAPMMAVDYLRQIALGLDAAHRLGIVHRDLKPANILFRTQEQPVISDFGVAKQVGGSTMLTQEQSIIGSLYYVSPEQISQDTCDPRSDLYSLGVVLCQMLTGKPPFRGSTSSEVMQAHLNDPIPRLPAALDPLQPLLDGLLAKDPDDRFQSIEELLAGVSWVVESQGWPQQSARTAS